MALLVGDMGGTKTELAVFASVTELAQPLAAGTYASSEYPSLEAIVHAFLADKKLGVDRACFGVAGPVRDGQATITNLPWIMDTVELKQALGVRSVILMNDLEALASAVPFLQADDLHTLHAGQPTQGGPIAVIAPGTGLGEAFLTWDGTRYTARMSEGGHADFAPTDDEQIELLRFLRSSHEHVSYERVCSGRGLPHIYAALRTWGVAPEPTWLTAQLAEVLDPTPIIITAAVTNTSELCVAAVKLFVRILGAEAGNLALKVLATGGIFVAGGIPPRIVPFLEDAAFLQAFLNKGRLGEALAPMPIHVILNRRVGLLGAAYHGFAMEQQER
ncbi:MAG: glucokinase [Herpetosiphon sp.]